MLISPLLAPQEWPLYSGPTPPGGSTLTSTPETTNGTAGGLTCGTPLVPASSGPPDQPAAPSNPSVVAPTRSSATPDQPQVAQSGVPPSHPDRASNRPDVPPTFDWAAYTQPSPTPEHLSAADPCPGGPSLQSDLSDSPVEVSTFEPPLILDAERPAPLPLPVVARSLRASSGQPRSQADRAPPPGNRPTIRTNANPPPKPLASITDEPVWMKKRDTLNYFRNTAKLGSLSDVIEHWYELEILLGFQDPVSVPTCPIS